MSNNVETIRLKVADLTQLLQIAYSEVEEIQNRWELLKRSEEQNAANERRIIQREQELVQKKVDTDAQSKYVEEQINQSTALLEKIKREKEALSDLAEQKRLLEKEQLEFAAQKKDFEGQEAEMRAFKIKLEEFEKEKELLMNEKKKFLEAQKLFAEREEKLHRQEEKIASLDRMTDV